MIRSYRQLSDATVNRRLTQYADIIRRVLQPGDTQVWYRKNNAPDGPIGFNDLTLTHVLMGRASGTDCEELFAALNFWSPTGEANNMVLCKGTHTSMSVGDILVIGNLAYVCAGIGWRVTHI